MKILHVEAGRNLYGGALQVVYLIRGLADRGVENLLVCPPGSAIEQAGREAGAVVHPVAMGGDLDLLLPVRLRRIIRTQRPDLVHLHSRRGADVLGGLAARWSQTPCVHSRRVDNPEFPFVARWKYRLFDRIVTISEGIRDVLLAEGVPGDRVVCVRSAIDTAAYDCSGETPWFRKEFDLKEGDRAVGMIAQFIRRKGHRDLLNALPAVLEKHPSLRVLLFGKGPLEQEVRRHATRLRLDPAVRFCGFRSDLKRVLPCLDALVHPAYMEGLGVSLLQAAASCVPIIATSVGGIPEIVHDGENGVLVPPGRTDRMAEALARLLSDPAGARAMGHAGRSMIKRNFSLEQMVTGNLRVYETVLRRQGGGV